MFTETDVRKKLLSPLLVLIAASFACLSSTNSTNPSSADTGLPDFLDRCIPASVAQYDNIQQGVNDIDTGNYIVKAFAVKSNDYEQVYFVAAIIYGTGIEDGAGPGIWAMNGEIESPSLTFSVNGFANEFSIWPDGASTDAQLSQSDDGAQEAANCAEYYK